MAEAAGRPVMPPATTSHPPGRGGARPLGGAADDGLLSQVGVDPADDRAVADELDAALLEPPDSADRPVQPGGVTHVRLPCCYWLAPLREAWRGVPTPHPPCHAA